MPPQCKLLSSSPSSSFAYSHEDESSGIYEGGRFTPLLELQRKQSHNDHGAQYNEENLEPQRRNQETDATKKPTNEYVLNVAFYSFLGFVLFQSAFALIAHSQSMMADSEAMSVDAMTYLFNLGAERLKHRPLSAEELAMPVPQRVYRRELRQLYLELVPPLVSVAILFLVTIQTLRQALGTLLAEGSLEHVDDDVSVHLMFFFSACNLTLDVINVTCFARTSSSYATLDVVRSRTPVEPGDECVSESSPLLRVHDSQDVESLQDNACSHDHGESKPEAVNLNMRSAYTHVFADALRSSAVLIVAAVATFFPSIRPEQADAVAAFGVSIIILACLVPLLRGLWATFSQIVHLHRHPWSQSSC